jgi:hypothetical protein
MRIDARCWSLTSGRRQLRGNPTHPKSTWRLPAACSGTSASGWGTATISRFANPFCIPSSMVKLPDLVRSCIRQDGESCPNPSIGWLPLLT